MIKYELRGTEYEVKKYSYFVPRNSYLILPFKLIFDEVPGR
jgi:hypothetical protein